MSNPKILIVEDDKLLLKAMRMKFEAVGYKVKIAENIDKALSILKEFVPSAMVLDLLLPKKDGFELLGIIKADKKLKNMPVLIASNLSDDANIEKGVMLSAAEYFVKSEMSLPDLINKVTYHINMSSHGKRSMDE